MGAEKIEYSSNGKMVVPDQPIIPYIEGDGVGPDIWKASVRIFDAAVERCYGSRRKVHWLEVYAGEKAFKYVVNAVLILPEKGMPLEVRQENARWIAPTEREQLTLVTCWPHDNNTHRVIVVAYPAG